MVFLTRARLAIGHRLLKPTVSGRVVSYAHFSRTYFSINSNFINKDFFRNYSSTEENNKNAMTLTKTATNMNSTLESGTINVIKVPSLGKKFKKCKIYKWFKNPGDFVNVDDLLCIVETDLIFGKVYSKLSGTIIENVNQEGSTVSVGSDLLVLVNNTMLSSNTNESKTSTFNSNQKRYFSTKKYVPMISFTRLKPLEGSNYIPSIAFGKSVVVGGENPPVEMQQQSSTPGSNTTSGNNSNLSNKNNKGKPPCVLDDFYKSPYKTWFRTLTDEEIEMINHGTVDVK